MEKISFIVIDGVQYVAKHLPNGKIILKVPLDKFKNPNLNLDIPKRKSLEATEIRLQKPFSNDSGFPPNRSVVRNILSQSKALK